MATDQSHLNNHQRRTLEKLTGHPLSHNIKWDAVQGLFEALGEVIPESGDRFRVRIGEHTAVFHPPAHGDLPADLVVAIRHFLQETSQPVAEPKPGRHLLVVIDHHESTIYEFEPPTAELETISPYDPHGHLRHLRHIKGNYPGQRAPEDPTYYRAVVEEVRGADMIVIFGHGDGHSNAADLLVAAVQEHLAEPLPKILTDVRIDVKDFTVAQLMVAAQKVVAELA
ncbi:hypothetical protein ACOJVU_14415 [Mycobacterium sp. THU-M104]|uniref:hypothetical protein n=1 Tax=Mycobacterium sp. THU-M104 TaxID=3410515 RepID=UPI003B9B4ACA